MVALRGSAALRHVVTGRLSVGCGAILSRPVRLGSCGLSAGLDWIAIWRAPSKVKKLQAGCGGECGVAVDDSDAGSELKHRIDVDRDRFRRLQSRGEGRGHLVVALEPILGARPIAGRFHREKFFSELCENDWNAIVVDRIFPVAVADRFLLQK